MSIPKKIIHQIRRSSQSDGNSWLDFANFLVYFYKRNKWFWDFSRFWKNFKDVEIDRPVFLLGVHRGGLTLISRIIRRHKDFVSVSGNYKYWSGADEMAVVLGPVLPTEFAGIRHKIPRHSEIEAPTGWIYACDKFISYFRKTRQDWVPDLGDKFKKIIKWTINRHAINKSKARLIDKSQIFTVRLSFLNRALRGSSPKFILVTRNPYAICYWPAKTLMNRKELKLNSFREALEITAQHWANSMKCALEDSNEVDNFLVINFEHFLSNPAEDLKKICRFIEVEYSKDLLPQPCHKIPFGSKGQNKWYPLRPDVNEKHFKKMTQEDVEIIHEYVGKLAKELGYSKPKL